MDQKGVLAVISGFSGAGKGTLFKGLLNAYPQQNALTISATPRAPRGGEEHGREYFFVSKERFEQMIAGDALIEYASYVGNYYGTPKGYVAEQMGAGKDVILEIEVQGALKVKERFPEALLVFVTPPDAPELEKRLRGRGTETEEAIRSRLKTAAGEAVFMDRYDYILVNGQLNACIQELHSLIQTQHRQARLNRGLIEKMSRGLSGIAQ